MNAAKRRRHNSVAEADRLRPVLEVGDRVRFSLTGCYVSMKVLAVAVREDGRQDVTAAGDNPRVKVGSARFIWPNPPEAGRRFHYRPPAVNSPEPTGVARHE